VESSILEKSHHDPVYNVFWIQSRLAQEFGSVSTDGRVLWWDARKLGDGPVDEMVLAANDTTFGGTAMEYRSDAGATKYLVGTEQGQCILADRKASKDKGSQKSIKAIYGERGRHHGPIYSIQRNPFNMKYFLTAGDWTTRIWSEDQKTQPLLTTRYSDSYLTGACWSPTRPGVFYNTKMDGTLDVWDFHYKMNDPIFTTKVGDFALSSIAVQQHGRLVAVGSEDGTTSVLEFSTGLSKMQPDEKNNIANMFERESKREKNLEMRYTQRKTLEKQKKAAPTPEFDPANPSWTDETTTAIKDAEEAFYGAIKEESGDKAEAGEEEKAAEE
jgi:dynein intermediate chain 2